MVDTLREFKSQDVIECVLCDGTVVNTGPYNGMIACAERELGKELQWSICHLHGNESPMRHVFNHLDGRKGTSGPNTFNGSMGKTLTQVDVHSKIVVEFEPIKAPSLPVLPDSIVKDLSRDQELLYKYSRAVDTGILPDNVANQKPGSINHARWLTLCLSALIDYTRDPKPSLSKVKFIDYVQKVYTPAWFSFKKNSKLQDGAKNVFTMLQLLKTQPKDIQNLAKKYVQINAFFAHSSNLLAAMLADEDCSIRKQAVDGIIEIRKNKEYSTVDRTDSGLRIFKVPKLNWEAENYTQIIDWELNTFCEPPITMKFSDDQIREFYSAPMLIPNYPSHCQSVERAVKLVSEVCGAGYYDHEERHKRILSNQAAKQERKSYDTKNKFKRIQKGIQTLREHNVM